MKTLIVKHPVIIKRRSVGEWIITILYSDQDKWDVISMHFDKSVLCHFTLEPSEYLLSEETLNELIDQAIYADMHSFEQRRDERAEMSTRD